MDWERASIAPGPMDLATLSMGWDENISDLLIDAYAAAEDGDSADPLGDLRTTHDFCRLHLCIQWLGWAQDWHPPAEHRQDRLQEALRLMDRHGL